MHGDLATERGQLVGLAGRLERHDHADLAEALGHRADALVAEANVSGTSELVPAARVADRAGGKVAIFGVQPAVAEVFSTIALDDLIPVLPDEAAARAQIGA